MARFVALIAAAGLALWAGQTVKAQEDIVQISSGGGTKGDLVPFTASMSNGTTAVSDVQFDILYDPAALQYTDGDYSLGALIAGWPVHDDHYFEPGHLRFTALDWMSSIPAGSSGDLVTFTFTVLCGSCVNGQTFGMDLAEPSGGISGFTALDGAFTFLRRGPPAPVLLLLLSDAP